jgi:hypothetical protein
MMITIAVRSSIKVDFTRKPQHTPLNPPPPPPLQKLLRLWNSIATIFARRPL